MEIWRDIRGYEGLYQCSNEGRVRSLDRVVKGIRNGKEVTWHLRGELKGQRKNTDGHLVVKLCKNGVEDPRFVHKLVAEAFIPNPNGYDVVHHKDHNPTNNRVENLCWMSKLAHDALHSAKKAEATRKVLGKRVDQIDKISGEVLYQWETVSDAADALGLCTTHISKCAQGKRKTHGNFVWKYVL